MKNQRVSYRHSLFLLIGLLISGCTSFDLLKHEQAARDWENEIKQLEKKDKSEQYPDDAVLYLGSSSIRLWKTIASDMSPYAAIQRGFGGSKFSDVYFYTERLVKPHKFRAVVIFVANDISGSPQDRTAKEVVFTFKEIVHKIHQIKPLTPVFLIEITPSNSRWAVWDKIRETNQLLKKSCSQMKNVHFIETANAYLDASGKPRSELFIQDQQHQNAEGYKIWTTIIKRKLDEVLKP